MRRCGVMRYLVILLAMVVSFAAPATAQTAALPYTLTFSGTSTQGAISGVWGGTFARGAYTGGRWVLIAEGKIIVAGTYRCGVGCTFDGSVDYETPTKFALYVDTLADTDRTQTVSGSVSLNLTPPTLVP
jgi:hypothetical protein